MKRLRSLLRASCVRMDSCRGQQPCLCPVGTAVLLGNAMSLTLKICVKEQRALSGGQREKKYLRNTLLLFHSCSQEQNAVSRKVSSMKLGFLFSDLERCGLEMCLLTLKILSRGGSSRLKLRKHLLQVAAMFGF